MGERYVLACLLAGCLSVSWRSHLFKRNFVRPGLVPFLLPILFYHASREKRNTWGLAGSVLSVANRSENELLQNDLLWADQLAVGTHDEKAVYEHLLSTNYHINLNHA